MSTASPPPPQGGLHLAAVPHAPTVSPVPNVASSSASIRQALKTFDREKLLRKCRDLLDLKDRQVEKLSSLTQSYVHSSKAGI